MLNRRSFLKSTGSFSGLFLPVMSFPQFNMIAANDQPLLTKATLKNSYWYIGHLLSVLLKSADTNGLYSLLKVTEIKGLETGANPGQIKFQFYFDD
ncbi:hypothetical protein [Chitinophaga ginsengisegetis]|uniref:hypothetical protein n=1 Tax=Chitinophaga ginsengisegetis TaxID=393003 RepID=UPI0009A593B9|nr:hypothetical protein [Chitinophaga ginsengisegetis]